MFFDEEMLLGLRLKTLNKYVDKFIIVESKYTHSGDKKKLIFDINNYTEFKNKINYIVIEDPPEDIEDIEKKLKSYLHHREYDLEPLGIEKIKNFVNNKSVIYDHRVDQTEYKFSGT